MHIDIWGDGASSGNGSGPGGWASIIKIDGEVVSLAHGGDTNTTNNIMEMQAVIGGLESTMAMLGIMGRDTGNTIKIISDSKYVIGAFRDGWVIKWIMCGWHTSMYNNTPRSNAEVWKKLVALVAEVESKGNIITWKLVKGHIGIPENETCDMLAKEEKYKQREKILNG